MSQHHIVSRGRFIRNVTSGWFVLVVEVVVAFALTPYIVSKLGASGYGLWGVAISVVGYLGLIDLGIRGSIGRYINHYLALKDARALDEVVGTSFLVLLALGFTALIATIAVAANFKAIFPRTPTEYVGDVRIFLPVMALTLLFSFVTAVLSNLLAARERLDVGNWASLTVLALRTAGTVWVLGAGYGLVGLSFVTVAVALYGAIVLYGLVYYVYDKRPPRLHVFNFKRLREIASFGVIVFAARAAGTVTVDAAPLIGMWTLGAEAVGIYSIALTLIMNGKRLLDQAGVAIYPSVMKAGALRDLDGLSRLYLRFMRVALAISGLVFIGMGVFAQDFLRLWVGPQFESGGGPIIVLGIGYILAQFGSTGMATLQSLDRATITLRVSLIQAAAALILMIAFTTLWNLGPMGLALGAAIPLAVTGTFVYPRLTCRIVGAHLLVDFRKDARRSLTILAAVTCAFVAVRTAFPPLTWHTFVMCVVICVGGYGLVVAHLFGYSFAALRNAVLTRR